MRYGLKTWPLVLFVFCQPTSGDQEASNVAHVKASEYGRCYAKSIPEEYYGARGATRIFRVEKERDVQVHAFDWFSQRIYIACNVSDEITPTGISVVRFGPWARGHQANAKDLAIAFYFKGELLKQYSTLDIAGTPENVSRSVSHYTVIDNVSGYRRIDRNRYAFDVKTIDGRALSFDPSTGRLTK